eukprot:5555989-Alexandrium_andersonii.AAC.1
MVPVSIPADKPRRCDGCACATETARPSVWPRPPCTSLSGRSCSPRGTGHRRCALGVSSSNARYGIWALGA